LKKRYSSVDASAIRGEIQGRHSSTNCIPTYIRNEGHAPV
jgi:hypothetical protein